MLIDLNDTNYTSHVASFDGPIFIDFYSPTCGPCQEVLAQLPHLDNVFKETAMIAKVDVTQSPKLAKKYEIRSVPFCVSIGTDKMVKDYELGAASVDRFIRMIKKAEGKGFFARLFG